MAMENPPFYVGNTSSNGPFSIAMLVYRSVVPYFIPYPHCELSDHICRSGERQSTTWRIILVSKWLITMVSKSPK